MRRIALSLFFSLFAFISIYGQSRREWLQFGDKAYDDKNYKLALSCYEHVLTFAGGDRDLVTPYECRTFVPAKKLVDSVALKASAQDSANLKNPNLVTGNDARTRWVVHRVAECY